MLKFVLFNRYDQIEKCLVGGQRGSYGTQKGELVKRMRGKARRRKRIM
jgi:hypothetical protein